MPSFPFRCFLIIIGKHFKIKTRLLNSLVPLYHIIVLLAQLPHSYCSFSWNRGVALQSTSPLRLILIFIKKEKNIAPPNGIVFTFKIFEFPISPEIKFHIFSSLTLTMITIFNIIYITDVNNEVEEYRNDYRNKHIKDYKRRSTQIN